ncbi:hypothetical protein [Aeromonas veronii]|uniref:hypothetical protein n=1 Tax=Aeromonas TaxID=642 RepID=UPI0011B1C8B6|nr:hypothetical protein [Aeromonas veronii]
MEIDSLLNQASKEDIIEVLRKNATPEQNRFLDVAREVENEMNGIPECCDALEQAVKSRTSKS